MLQRVKLRQIPVSRLVRPRSQLSHPINRSPPAGQVLRRQPQQQQQTRSFHYDPNAVVYQLPLRTRLRYMAWGALSLVAVGGSLVGYRVYGLYGQRDELQDELKEALEQLKAFNEEFASGFARARAADDHHGLRRLTFDLVRKSHADAETGRLPPFFVEFGELPGLPFDDPRSGRELVAREDTMMLLEKGDDERIAACHLAVNLELSEVYRGLADPKPDPDSDKLSELFARLGDQIELWRRQGRLFEDEEGRVDLVVFFGLREKNWALEYGEGHWNALSGPHSLVQESESVVRAEEILEAMTRKDKSNLFGRGPRS